VTGVRKILVLGASGQVGIELQRSFAGFGEIIAADRDRVDLSGPDQIRDAVRRTRPDVILNAAAYTAVDRAESEPELAMAINGHAPGILAEEAKRHDSILVHYSTDYVFDGTKEEPWTEADPTHPLNVYGASKLAGEEAIRQVAGRYLIFRTSWIYGPHGRNFLLTMLRLGRERDCLSVVDDQVGAPTSSIEIADATRAILDGVFAGRFGSDADWSGLCHMTCSGSTSWYGFAQAIFERAAEFSSMRSPALKPVPSSDYATAARRPANSALCNSLLRSRFDIQLAPWKAALHVVMSALSNRDQTFQVS